MDLIAFKFQIYQNEVCMNSPTNARSMVTASVSLTVRGSSFLGIQLYRGKLPRGSR